MVDWQRGDLTLAGARVDDSPEVLPSHPLVGVDLHFLAGGRVRYSPFKYFPNVYYEVPLFSSLLAV